MKVQTKMLY